MKRDKRKPPRWPSLADRVVLWDLDGDMAVALDKHGRILMAMPADDYWAIKSSVREP